MTQAGAPEDQHYDVVIVGGGAAGLAGALTLGRSRRSVLVVDAGSPRNAAAGHVHNYLGREGTPPRELLEIGRAEVAQYGVQVSQGRVVDVRGWERPGIGFVVTLADQLADHREVTARRLLVASGVTDVLPHLPGLAERWGRDVLHCPYCHGWEVPRPGRRRAGHRRLRGASGAALPPAHRPGGRGAGRGRIRTRC